MDHIPSTAEVWVIWAHFIHLFWRTIYGMPLLVSSNWAASILGAATFVFTEFALYMTTPPSERWKRLRLNFLIGLAVTAFAYSTLFVWSTIQTVYDEHHDSIGRWRAVVKEKDSLKTELKKRDDYITKLKAIKRPDCSRSGGHISPPVAPNAIHSASAGIKLICTLRSSLTMPEDVEAGFSKDVSYLEGAIGKSYLESLGKTHYQRTEEEGKVSVSESYSLPANSDLLNEQFSELNNYNTITLHVAGADGSYFSKCDFYEVAFRVNGQDVYRTSGNIPAGKVC